MRSHNILVTRTDRLGDVLLTLPSLGYLRQALPSSYITFCCSEGFEDLLMPYLNTQAIDFLPAPSGFRDWGAVLRHGNFSAGLFFHTDTKLLLASSWLVPVRMGPLAKWPSYLFLTAGQRQKRSEAIKSEAEYNLELSQAFVRSLSDTTVEPAISPIELPIDGKAASEAVCLLKNIGITIDKPFVVIHPGMGNSALNLSAAKYVEFIRYHLIERLSAVVLTEGPNAYDRELVAAIVSRLPMVQKLAGVPLSVLKEIFRKALLVVAPSTGVLHLAHLVGTRTVGFYSPIKSHSHTRWKPWGGTKTTCIISPQVDCAGNRRCLGEQCRHYFCMDQVVFGQISLSDEQRQ